MYKFTSTDLEVRPTDRWCPRGLPMLWSRERLVMLRLQRARDEVWHMVSGPESQQRCRDLFY